MSTDKIQLLKLNSLPQLTENFRSQILDGNVNPLQAFAQLNLLAKAADAAMKDPQVLDAALDEFAKHNLKAVTMGDCKIEQIEAGTKYDYSVCEDPKLAYMQATHDVLGIDIKERQDMLKHIPDGGMADPETGALVYRPAKTSKTTLKITFKK